MTRSTLANIIAIGLMAWVGTATGTAMARPPERILSTISARLMPPAPIVMERRATRAMAPATGPGLVSRVPAGPIMHRSAMVETGDLTLGFSADRTRTDRNGLQPLTDLDRWSLRAMGADAALSLSDEIALAASGSVMRLKRLQGGQDGAMARLSTKVMRFGLGLLLGEDERLSLDYVSVSRSARPDPYLRLIETLSGAPPTGQGPELAFETRNGEASGSTQWRFSLASMRRPERDFGYRSAASQQDMRAMANFVLKL